MRVNIYAEEMTEHIEIIAKEIEGTSFTGCRFYLHLPVTVGGGAPQRDGTPTARGEHESVDGSQDVFPPINGKPAQVRGPFIHHPGDDDSSAVTFWGKRDLRVVLRTALARLDQHYAERHPAPATPVPADADHLRALLDMATAERESIRGERDRLLASLDAVRVDRDTMVEVHDEVAAERDVAIRLLTETLAQRDALAGAAREVVATSLVTADSPIDRLRLVLHRVAGGGS